MFKLLALLLIASIMAVVVVPGVVEGSNPDAARTAAPADPPRAATVLATAGPLTTTARRRTCDRNYSGRCLRPNASDYDCAGGSGNGPRYVRGPFSVVGSDHYGLDSDGDGVACESY